MKGKKILSRFVPPVLMDMISSRKSSRQMSNLEKDYVWWHGDFETWSEAQKLTTGYEDHSILTKVRDALLKVKNGEAVFERDSVIFDTVQYRWPLLACLQHVALASENTLNVLDFGGSLGSSYFQNRTFLTGLRAFKWIVVEQKHFVDCGRKDFENDVLQFEESMDAAVNSSHPNCLLLSGVLQYLNDPVGWLEYLLSHKLEYVILDRTGLIASDRDHLTIQEVPKSIYEAKYPCWFFSEKLFKDILQKNYHLLVEFDDVTTPPIMLSDKPAFWKGYFLKRKS